HRTAYMKLKTSCSTCSASLSVDADLIGRNAKCPRCRTTFIIQEVQAASTTRSLEQAVAAETTSVDRATTISTKQDESLSPRRKAIGRFEIRGVLGQGGFGRVYKAYDPQLDRVVALKVPTFGTGDTQKAQRFQQE